MKIVYIQETDPDVCELCGGKAELRPYGPNNENICFPCGMKDIATTQAKFEQRLQNGDVNTEATLH